MELLLAGSALHLGQLVVGVVEDVEADVALLHALEPLVHVALPDRQPVHDVAVLLLQICLLAVFFFSFKGSGLSVGVIGL